MLSPILEAVSLKAEQGQERQMMAGDGVGKSQPRI